MGLQAAPSRSPLTAATFCQGMASHHVCHRWLRWIIAPLFILTLSGCELLQVFQVPESAPQEFERQQHYRCQSGESVMVSYSATGDSAMLLYKTQTHVLPKVASHEGMHFQGGQWGWQVNGERATLFHDHQRQAKEQCSRLNEESRHAHSLVSGQMIIPADLPSIDRAVLDLRLYKYHPFMADQRAELVDWVQSPAFVHQQGERTERPFQIGTQEPRDTDMQYYLTLYILEEGHRTYIGECQHVKQGLCKVLTKEQPAEVDAIAKKLGL